MTNTVAMNKKLLKILLTLLIILLFMASIFFIWRDEQVNNPGETTSPTPTNNLITIVGQIVCLPHREKSDFYTMECAYGFKDHQDNYYSLMMNEEAQNQIYDLPMNVEITLIAYFEEKEDKKYLSQGILTVEEIILPSISPSAEIKSFVECEAAGFLVMESYPRRCSIPSGATFTEEISQ